MADSCRNLVHTENGLPDSPGPKTVWCLVENEGPYSSPYIYVADRQANVGIRENN